MDSAVIIICALLLNALLAGPKIMLDQLRIVALLHKPAGILRTLERRLNREHRSKQERQIRGVVVAAAVFSIGLITGIITDALLQAISPFLTIFVAALLLPVRPSYDVAAAIRKALASGNITAGQNALKATAWRHYARLDAHGVARAAVEYLAVQFSEKIVAPAFWYVIGGLPGLFCTVLITLMHETLVLSGGEFARAAKGLYRVLQWLPSRLAACLWMAASLFQAQGNYRKMAKAIWGHMAVLPPQALAVACSAELLRVSLGGPPSVYVEKEWLGIGTTKLTPQHIKKAQYFFCVQLLLLLMVLGLIM